MGAQINPPYKHMRCVLYHSTSRRLLSSNWVWYSKSPTEAVAALVAICVGRVYRCKSLTGGRGTGQFLLWVCRRRLDARFAGVEGVRDSR